jgi:hypothetical protein
LNKAWRQERDAIEEKTKAVPPLDELFAIFVGKYRSICVDHRFYGPGKLGGELRRPSANSGANLMHEHFTTEDEEAEPVVS